VDLPVAFDAFRHILRNTGENWASLEAPYEACLWAAIRAGWREGYSVEDARNAGHATKFSIDISHALGAQRAEADDSWLPQQFQRPFQIADASYSFAPDEIAELASKYGAGLTMAEELHDRIRRARSSSGAARTFDFEVALGAGGAPLSAKHLLFCLHWLKTRGRAAQLIAPPLTAGTVAELAAVARYFNATLSFALGEAGESLLDEIGAATAGRVNCRVAGGFDAPQLAGLAARLRG
jgi:hypothetical protein